MGDARQFQQIVQIEKVDESQRIVWGWAYVCEEGGKRVVDHSGQYADPIEIQKAAHAFVLDSRAGGESHKGAAGYVVDSIFFSKQVQDALGIDLGRTGWFIGMQLATESAWEGVRTGVYKAFSIAGAALMEEVEENAA